MTEILTPWWVRRVRLPTTSEIRRDGNGRHKQLR
jgi:hypothetical protein